MAGCGSSASSQQGLVKPGSGVALNPSGKPQSQAEANYQSAVQNAGSQMNAQRAKDAAAMQAARNKGS